ncbi:hypothetical protein M0R04_05585 [Candidatus Dojkabacteria bacterium]|jgi:hypothetical protein|nr:hypothetical protein [Candidatus Dojkabacteria bacterium]
MGYMQARISRWDVTHNTMQLKDVLDDVQKEIMREINEQLPVDTEDEDNYIVIEMDNFYNGFTSILISPRRD